MEQAKDELRRAVKILFTTECHPVLQQLAEQAGVTYLYKDHKSITRLAYIIAGLAGYTSRRKQAL